MAAENMFSSRKEAVNHLKTVVLEASGQGVQIDAKASGKSRVVFRCPAVFELLPGQLKGRASSVIHQYITKKKAGFDCPKLAGEGTGAHQRRRFEAAEKHAYQNNYCRFKSILKIVKVADEVDSGGSLDGDKFWKFNEVGGDDAAQRMYVPHCSDCTDVGKATGQVLAKFMATAVSANPHMFSAAIFARVGSSGVGDARPGSRARQITSRKPKH